VPTTRSCVPVPTVPSNTGVEPSDLSARNQAAVPVALMLESAVALVPSLVLLARHGSAARKMAIPFAPFLALGGVVALFFGDELLDAYLTLF